MSEPKRYEYVSDGYTARFLNPQTGHAAPYGEYVRYSDYAELKAEVGRLDHQVRYWRIEAEVDNARWLRCLEDLEKLRKDSQP